MATVDQLGSVRIPEGKLIVFPPVYELVAVIVREFPSSSTKNDERS
jgi:hypothetical protein